MADMGRKLLWLGLGEQYLCYGRPSENRVGILSCQSAKERGMMQNEIYELRRQVRNLRRCLFGVVGLAGLGLLLAATASDVIPEVVKAGSFEVVSEDGKSVLVLGSHMRHTGLDEKTHYGFMDTRDSHGVTLVSIGGAAANDCLLGDVVTFNSHGRPLVSLGIKLNTIEGLSPGAYDMGQVRTYAGNGQISFDSAE
ncbi:MAG: hypothetical protein CMJ39_00840 [Phycisphaerae bacterium]|nr:hypothetical protein [Phycisphaerae bacterium]